MKTILNLESLGIVSKYEKNILEDYVLPHLFQQRKTYAEYYITGSKEYFCEMDISDLMILAEDFSVNVICDEVILGRV